MVSVSLNSTSASALSLLTGSTKALEATQTKVASGRKVDEAADNAAYWSIATTMKSGSLSLSSAEDATGLSAAIADTAALGMEAATSIVSDIQAKLVMAKAVGADKTAINTEISQLKEQLGTIASSSSFNGQNWLNLSEGQAPKVTSMVSSVTTDSSGDLSVNVIDFDTAQSALVSKENASDGVFTRSYFGLTSSGSTYEYYLLDADSAVPASATASEIAIDDNTSSSELNGMIAAVSTMLADMTDAGAAIGATKSRISAGTEFLQDLQDITDIGIGRLVDADLEEEAANLSAQRVQQQLQTIGLNIANNQPKSLMTLFT
ncbi:flagellar hook associated protein [Agrobacterium sp. a22-2]|uniref:flagellin N-terminal helical domain-containing protein n=1 Tax=Agrobacterium sp. a22-2 TaxID=2283840 RepID=UPI0014457358|nr:flagellin [Agrobacterium sp. a22-2]NKN38361.1 flagellar hook associated protein [Agrobacterium sp. a22-2]